MKAIPLFDDHRKLVRNTYSKQIDFQNQLINEEVVDVRDYGLAGDNYYYKINNPPYYMRIPGSIERLLMRKSIVEKLIRINDRLNQKSLELYIFDCYRPIEVQNYLYESWYPKYLRKLYPDLSPSKLLQKRKDYVAKGYKSEIEIDKNTPPPHSTAAAIDLTLRFADSKELLFMGTIFDEISENIHTDYLESLSQQKILSLSEEEALKNRRILYWAMIEEGFENYPDEWWHYSFGDQMWAMLYGNSDAYYSCIEM